MLACVCPTLLLTAYFPLNAQSQTLHFHHGSSKHEP